MSKKQGQDLLERFDRFLLELESLGLTREELLKKLSKKTEIQGVPYSIFGQTSLSVLESIVKYLRESLNMTYNEIGEVLYRNPIPIGITYRRTLKKYKKKLDDTSTKKIPLDIFKNTRLSALENVVLYLKNLGYRFSEIADILNRDDRTIWTVYNRAHKKGGAK